MGLLDLLLPLRCIACSASSELLCAKCRQELPFLRPPLCGLCGAPTAWPVARCRECSGRRLFFARARAALGYEAGAVCLVRAWKNSGRRGLTGLAAELVAGSLSRPDLDAVTFVPGVPDRDLWRGHNAAEGLARELGRLWNVPVEPVLRRMHAARPQRGLSSAERRRNVADAFAPIAAVPSRIVLVDDVFTTGATASAAARALRRAGAERVEVVALARALRGGATR